MITIESNNDVISYTLEKIGIYLWRPVSGG